jgi:hypothetical protein
VATRVRKTDDRQRVYEDHPSLHEWEDGLTKDVVVERTARKVPLVLRRYEYCYHCPIQRISLIDVLQWHVRSRRYIGHKDVIIIRKPRAQALKEKILATTDLPDDDRARLEKVAVKNGAPPKADG